MRVALQIVLTQDQKQTLQQWACGRSLPARQRRRWVYIGYYFGRTTLGFWHSLRY